MKITKDLLREMIEEEIAAVNEEEAASKTKTSVADCKISGLRRVEMDIDKNNILTVTVEKDGKVATGSHPVKSANRMNLAMNAAGLKARTAWIEKYGCPK